MYPILNDNIKYRRLQTLSGNTFELLCPGSGNTVSLNDDSDKIVSHCTGNNSIEEIISLLTTQYPDERKLVEKHVHGIVTMLVENGFMTVPSARPDQARQAPAIVNIPYQLTTLTIEVTGKCNLRCRHCYADSSPLQQTEMTDDVLFSMLDEFSDLAGIYVAFTGGEPLLKNSIFDLIAHAARKNLSVKLMTNGSLITKDVARMLFDSGLRNVQVSLDGHTPELHDEYRCSRGAFEKTVRSISLLGDLGIKVDVATVVNKLNLPYLRQIVEFCGQWGIIPAFNRQQQAGRALHEANAYFVTNQEYIEATYAIDEHLSQVTGKNRFRYPVRKQAHRCSAGVTALTVKSNGDVVPCLEFKDPRFVVGNMCNSRLAQIWNNNTGFLETLRAHRLEHVNLCAKCGNNRFCNGGCPGMAFDIWGDICWPDIEKCAMVQYASTKHAIIEYETGNDDRAIKYCG